MRLRLTVLVAAFVAALWTFASTATAATPPPSYLCTRSTLGVTVASGGHVWKCSVYIRFVGPYAYTTYYWLDLGMPA